MKGEYFNEMNTMPLSQFLHSHGFVKNLKFAFNGTQLFIAGESSNPVVYVLKTCEMALIGSLDKTKTDPITAVAICEDGNLGVTGYADGNIKFWSLKTRRAGNRYVLLHNDEITDISFIENDSRLIICDKAGIMTSVSVIRTAKREMIMQSTIINLTKPLLSFCSLPPNLVAFVSEAGFTFIRAGCRIEILQNSSPFTCKTTTCALAYDGTAYWTLLTVDQSLRLTKICDKDAEEYLEQTDVGANIVKSLILKNRYILLVLDYGDESKCQLLDFDGEIKTEYTGPPLESVETILFCGQSLIMFMANEVKQFEFDFN